MEKLREFLSRKGVLPGLAFIAGLIIGLVVLGWGVFPVQWTNGTPADMQSDLQKDYLRMAVTTFASDQNSATALLRWKALGPTAPEILKAIEKEPEGLSTIQIVAFTGLVQGGEAAASVQVSQPASTEMATQPAKAGSKPTKAAAAEVTTVPSEQAASLSTLPAAVTPAATQKSSSPDILSIALVSFCLLTLILAGTLFYIFVLKKNKTMKNVQPGIDEEGVAEDGGNQPIEGSAVLKEPEVTRSGTPVAQYMTTYMIGDDVYDDSFSIDSPLGEFLGECGVGISDTIGVGDPKKVSAFEVWLFDKNDIQTVTKVMMSEHAFGDESTVQKLRAKGEPVQAESGKRLILETATLQLEARIVDLNYGQGALPTNSYFDRMTLELAIWPKK